LGSVKSLLPSGGANAELGEEVPNSAAEAIPRAPISAMPTAPVIWIKFRRPSANAFLVSMKHLQNIVSFSFPVGAEQ
jgi:hypothetical protein